MKLQNALSISVNSALSQSVALDQSTSPYNQYNFSPHYKIIQQPNKEQSIIPEFEDYKENEDLSYQIHYRNIKRNNTNQKKVHLKNPIQISESISENTKMSEKINQFNFSEEDLLNIKNASLLTNTIKIKSDYELFYAINDVYSIFPPFQTCFLPNNETNLVIHFNIKNNTDQIWRKEWEIKSTDESQICCFNQFLKTDVLPNNNCYFDLIFHIGLNQNLRCNKQIFTDEIQYLIFGFYNKDQKELSFNIGFTLH